MKDKYQDLYRRLVNAYYNRNFEEVFEHMLKTEFENKEEAREILSALCGVENDVNKDDYIFTQVIIDSITKGRVREKIVQKVHKCTEDCEQSDGKSKCQSVCPFDAIIRAEDGVDKTIDPMLCMSCGRCVTACDRGNYLETPQFLPLANLLDEDEKVVAIVAPAIAGQFGENISLDQLREAFIKVGFSDMVEVAMAADILSFKEALEFNEHVKEKGDVMITSCCCPMWVSMLRKVYHQFIKDVSPSVSPMIAMGRVLKALNPDVKIVFISPCVAKKAEAKEPDLVGTIDFVVTFQEMKMIFDLLHIEPAKLKGVPSVDYAATGGRLYARTGGVSEAVFDVVDELFPESRKLFTSMSVDGVPDCKRTLNELTEGKIRASFIEGMGCKGGCVGGPKTNVDEEKGKEAVNRVAYESAIKNPLNSEILNDLLHKIGVEDIYDLKDGNSMFERHFE
ncbi:MAG: iron hydrogenase [Lachnospiraceae bacterium]|nr:iron hydrogenase [Lachnospiraceae bacterium]